MNVLVIKSCFSIAKRLLVLTAVILTLLLSACSTTDSGPANDSKPIVMPGGMEEFTGDSLHDLSSPQSDAYPQSASLPSCRSITYRGKAGYIAVQTSSSGYVSWGIYLYNKADEPGPWKADVFVNGKRVDGKVQEYAPHGSVSPKHATKGGTFSITASHITPSGRVVGSIPNACRIP